MLAFNSKSGAELPKDVAVTAIQGITASPNPGIITKDILQPQLCVSGSGFIILHLQMASFRRTLSGSSNCYVFVDWCSPAAILRLA